MFSFLNKPISVAALSIALLLSTQPASAEQTSPVSEQSEIEVQQPTPEADSTVDDTEAPTTVPVAPPTTQPNPLLQDVKKRRDDSVGELSEARLTDAQLSDKIEEIEKKITDKEEELEDVKGDLEEKERDVTRIQNRVTKLEGEILALERIVRTRAVALYMGQAANDSPTSILLSSKNPTEFQVRRMMVETANSSDKEVVDMLADKKEEVEESKREAEQTRDEVKAIKDILEDEVEKMEEERELVAFLRAVLDERVTALRSEVDALAQEEKALRSILGYPEDPALDVPTSVQRPASSEGLIWPVDGVLTSVFGMRWGALHAGIDVGAPTGTPVYATKDGTVIFSGVQGGYGNIVIIDHGDGFSTSHAHLSRNVAIQGSRVLQGELIGLVGSTGDSTGPHLHFETRVRGVPYDPIQYLPRR